MKLSFSLFFVSLISTANCFVVPSRTAFASRLQARPDASALVEEALKITATYGISSPEAALAWETVEEVDASDNTPATMPSLDVECAVEEEPTPECIDYGKFLDELNTLRNAMPEKDDQKMSLIDVLKNIKMQPPEPAKAESSEALTAALEEAKSATAEHGITSPQARLAWETYEEIASAGLDNAMGISLLDECSIESGQEACQAMEELERILPVLQALSLQAK